MIEYAIWDQTDIISDRFLRQYIRNTFNKIGFDVYVDHDFDYILKHCDQKYLVVFGSGHITKNIDDLKNCIADFCSKNEFVVSGHIIHHVNSYPFLHVQTTIINMEKYREIGSPMIGHYEESEVLQLHKPERSVDNIYSDYTPLWLKPSQEIFSCISRKFGWNLISESLNHGIPVLAIPKEIRMAKDYLYQNDKPHLFSRCLQELSRNKLKVIPSTLNANQQNYLKDKLAIVSS